VGHDDIHISTTIHWFLKYFFVDKYGKMCVTHVLAVFLLINLLKYKENTLYNTIFWNMF